jgi:death-on-curing protein
MKLVYLTRAELLRIHRKVTHKFQSGNDDVLLFEGNLDFCVEAPKREVFGEEIHKTVPEKAAALMSSIDKLHPFLDGNKRTGFEACDVFLRINGFAVDIKKDEAVSVSLKIAECTMDIYQTSIFLEDHTRKEISQE